MGMTIKLATFLGIMRYKSGVKARQEMSEMFWFFYIDFGFGDQLFCVYTLTHTQLPLPGLPLIHAGMHCILGLVSYDLRSHHQLLLFSYCWIAI